MAEYIATRVGTMGAGLDHCHIPGTGPGEAHLDVDEGQSTPVSLSLSLSCFSDIRPSVELGMGIHNEPGVLRMKLPSSAELVKTMLAYITDTTDEERGFLPFKNDGTDEVLLLVNNLGGMSELELSAIANDAVKVLEDGPNKISVRRIMVGTVMTSLNLPGFSLTLLLLPRAGDKHTPAQILELIDAHASAPGWRFMAKGEPGVPAAPGSSTVSEPPAIKSGGAPIARKLPSLFSETGSA
jgi:dihydroxyacetone kinase